MELLFEIREVAVGVTVTLRFAEAYTVDDGGMIEGITDDRVLGREEGFEYPAVGVEAGRKENGVLGVEERGERLLKFAVHALGPTDESHGCGAVTPTVESGVAGGDEIGVVAETEVVIGTKVEHFATIVERDARALGRTNDALTFVEAVRFDRFERGGEVLAVGGRH